MSDLTIAGLQEAQQAMMKLVAAVRPSGALGRAVRYLYIDAHRYLVSITHVDTGSYKNSQYVERLGEASYLLHIAPNTVNPRSGSKPSEYGLVEEARGGDHAAYARTYAKREEFASRAQRYLMSQLP